MNRSNRPIHMLSTNIDNDLVERLNSLKFSELEKKEQNSYSLSHKNNLIYSVIRREPSFFTLRPPNSKGYRSRHPKRLSDDESEGDSDSDDPNFVWRGINLGEYLEITSGIENTPYLYDLNSIDTHQTIREHIEHGSDRNHQCPFISASRSMKVAARYASHRLNNSQIEPSGFMVKIRLEHDYFRVDLTNPEELKKVGLSKAFKKCAQNSQEVILMAPLLKRNIEGIYSVHSFGYWQRAQLQYEKSRNSDEKSFFVKFRAYEKNQYYHYRITPLQFNEENKQPLKLNY